MRLMTPEIEAAFRKTKEPAEAMEALVVAKFFFPIGRYTFYATEGKMQEDGDWIFFGYCISPLGPDCDEWGSSALSEMSEPMSCGPFKNLHMERDLAVKPLTKTVAQLMGRNGTH